MRTHTIHKQAPLVSRHEFQAGGKQHSITTEFNAKAEPLSIRLETGKETIRLASSQGAALAFHELRMSGKVSMETLQRYAIA